MRWLNILLLLILLGLQYRLWIGAGSLAEVASLGREIAEQQQQNDKLIGRNKRLENEVISLKSGLEAVEERARSELGMQKRGETFYLIVEKPVANP
jgi:cell division protein FtsB